MVGTIAARMTERAYRALALTEAGKLVELWDGEPREKPAVSVEHSDVIGALGAELWGQVGREAFVVRENVARLRISGDQYLIPDIAVVPIAFVRALRARRGSLDAYAMPVPLVAGVWSPSTGGYDVTAKLAAYQQRGDGEIWHLHPYERTLTAWVRQPDGRSEATTYRDAVVRSASLEGVALDLAVLFAG